MEDQSCLIPTRKIVAMHLQILHPKMIAAMIAGPKGLPMMFQDV
jgi:hypothetical protein